MRYVLVHHATSVDRLDSILADGFRPTSRDASWLGYGVYFFYRAPHHARAWARDTAKRRKVDRGAIVAAEIDLKGVVNLLDREYWPLVRKAYANVPSDLQQIGPGYRYETAPDPETKIGWNYRDCFAINTFAAFLESKGLAVNSIVAAFSEGDPIAENSWLFDQSSVILNVRNPEVIRIVGHEVLESVENQEDEQKAKFVFIFGS